MADVYRCRLRGPGGFEKIVVVKRIRPERAADPCFVNMFLDEARLVASLNHPNIVQVFEIGEADGLPYIAMEYVKGPTLSALMREARRAGEVHRGPRRPGDGRRLRRAAARPHAPSARAASRWGWSTATSARRTSSCRARGGPSCWTSAWPRPTAG